MNNQFKKIDIEQVLFLDLESTYNTENLQIDSKEFELYRNKTRNRETGEFLENLQIIEHYKKNAALRPGFNKIISLSVGIVSKGILYIKSFYGEEEKVLRDFYEVAEKYQYFCGVNILEFDLPVARINSMRYNLSVPERLNDFGQKSWNMKSVYDLMSGVRGTYWMNLSLAEICNLLNITSPKNKISGEDVPELFYKGGIKEIVSYNKADILATVNIFLKLQGKEIFTEFVDRNESSQEIEETEPTLIQRLYITKHFSQELKDSLLSAKKPPKTKIDKEKQVIKEILLAHYLEKISIGDRETKEKKEINLERTQEIEEFIEQLWR